MAVTGLWWAALTLYSVMTLRGLVADGMRSESTAIVADWQAGGRVPPKTETAVLRRSLLRSDHSLHTWRSLSVGRTTII